MRDLIIVSSDDPNAKSRSFRGTLLAHAACPRLWLGGDTGTLRPIWAMVATSDAESFPFIRNLQLGHKARIHSDGRGYGKSTEHFDCMKSAGYDMKPQRHVVGHDDDGRPVVAVAWTIYLPDAYRIDPGMVDPTGVKFAVMPGAEWPGVTDDALARRLAELYRSTEFNSWEISRGHDSEEHDRRLLTMQYVVRIAAVFADRLDRRTNCPLIPEIGFQALVLAAMLDAQMVSLASQDRRDKQWGHAGMGYDEDLGMLGASDTSAGAHDTSAGRMLPGLVCSVTHDRLAPLLAQCVRWYEAGMMDPSKPLPNTVAEPRQAA